MIVVSIVLRSLIYKNNLYPTAISLNKIEQNYEINAGVVFVAF